MADSNIDKAQGEVDAPVSFTDTNAETGMTGRNNNGLNQSRMQDLINQLKKKSVQSETLTETKGEEEKSDGKKKKKKKGKGKTKKVRGQDRFESQNYLFRIEGTICCTSMLLAALWMILTAILFVIILIATQGDLNHIFIKNKINHK